MKSTLVIFFLVSITIACNNREGADETQKNDTMEFVPGFGGGHESGKGEVNSPSYPRETYQNESTTDTTRGIHGVNVDTTGN